MAVERVLQYISRPKRPGTVFQRLLMGLAVLAFVGSGLPLSAWAIPDGTYNVGSHISGSERPPAYGLRLDGFNGGGTWTFDANNPASSVLLTKTGSTIRIYGDIQGGEDTGGTWTPIAGQLYTVDMTYNAGMFAEVSDGTGGWDDTTVSGPSSHHLNFGTLVKVGGTPAERWDLRSHAKNGNGLALQLGDKSGISPWHRNYNGISVWGWVDWKLQTDPWTSNSGHPSDTGCCSDWLLTAQPVPEPSTMLLFGSGLVGLALWRYRKTVKA